MMSTNIQGQKKRMHWLDVCKGIAIILVVIGHVGSIYSGIDELNNAHFFHILHDTIYTFHMPLFLLISGFLFEKGLKKDPFQLQAKKKILSYGIPYIVFSLLYWLLKIIASGFVNNRAGFRDLILIPIIPLSFMWYIYAVLLLSLLTMALKKVGKSYNSILIIAVLSRILWEVLTMIPTFQDSFLQDIIITDCIKNYLWFAFGAAYGKVLFSSLKKMSFLAKIILISSCLILIIIAAELKINAIPFIRVIWGSAGSAAVIAISMLIGENSCLEYLGKYTLPVYLLHGSILSASKILFTKLKLPLLYGVGPLLCCTLCGLFISLFIYKLCSRFKTTDLLFYPARYITITQ